MKILSFIFLLFLPLTLLAEKRNYVLELPNGDIKIVKATRPTGDWAQYVVTTVPDRLADKALELIKETDSFGIERVRARIDEVKESQRQQALADAEAARRAREQRIAERIARLKQAYQNYDSLNAAQVRVVLRDIIAQLRFIDDE